MQKNGFFLIAFGIVLIMALAAGCTSSSATGASSDATPLPTATLNVCKIDPEGADVWKAGPVNLWDKPGDARTKVNGKLPACENVQVTVLDENGEYIKIKSGSQSGWVLKSIVFGE